MSMSETEGDKVEEKKTAPAPKPPTSTKKEESAPPTPSAAEIEKEVDALLASLSAEETNEVLLEYNEKKGGSVPPLPMRNVRRGEVILLLRYKEIYDSVLETEVYNEVGKTPKLPNQPTRD
jgi:hypothetical protein